MLGMSRTVIFIFLQPLLNTVEILWGQYGLVDVVVNQNPFLLLRGHDSLLAICSLYRFVHVSVEFTDKGRILEDTA